MALEIWRKWRKSGIDPFGRYGQPDLGPTKPRLPSGQGSSTLGPGMLAT
jgi:hypothetical protein